MFTELDVVNEMLSTMGITPLNGLSEDNPDTANCRRIIDTCNKTTQGTGWWFNREEIDLFADADSGFIYIPGDTLSCDPVCERGYYQVVVRGRRLYNTLDNTYVFPAGAKVKCKLIRLVPFDDLPVLAQRAVMLAAVIKFQQNYDADNTKSQFIMQEYAKSMIDLKSENIRNMNSSLLWKKSTAYTLNRINGYRDWR